jgi:hypothetical protein
MAPREQEIRFELIQLQSLIEEITGLRSRWDGVVELVADADFKGKKPFSCMILIDAALADEEVRWRTAIHELLHAVSTGYVPTHYAGLIGWEEGVVEQLQRLIRPEILARLGLGIAPQVFDAYEEHHLFNRYIHALEQLRTALGRPDRRFYLDLLETPLRDRPGHVLGLGMDLPDAQRASFVRVFSTADAILRR